MKLTDLVKQLARVGLPLLGTAIAGPAGAAVGQMIGNAVIAPQEDVPETTVGIVKTILGDPDLLQKARQFEAEHGKAILQMHLDALSKSDAGQVELIKGDQQKPLYDRGWRPGAAWICVFGMGYTYAMRPLLPWILTVTGVADVPALPAIDTTELFVMLGGLLGLGTMRHIERVKGKV